MPVTDSHDDDDGSGHMPTGVDERQHFQGSVIQGGDDV